MPAAVKYTTDTKSEEWKRQEAAFAAELAARRAAHSANWAYYKGEHKEPLKRDKTKTNDNLIINVTGLSVDKAVANMIGPDEHGEVQGVSFEIIDETGEPGFVEKVKRSVRKVLGQQDKPKDDQTYLDKVMKANSITILMLEALLNSSVTGHVFIKLLPTGREDVTGSPLPRLVNLNPSNTSAFWAADDMERVLWYRIQFGEGKDEQREDYVREVAADGTDTGRWLVYRYTKSSSKSDEWVIAPGEAIVWPYAWAPIIDWKNAPNPNQYYGRSDIEGLGRLNDGLNFVASNTQRILKHHAHPKTIATGATKGDIEGTSVDGMWTIKEKEAKVANLEMQSDLASSLEFVNMIRRVIFDLARELDPGSVQDKLGDITNFGLRVLFGDSLAKGGVKRLLAGDGLMRLCRRILELGSFDPHVEIHIDWPSPLPSDLNQLAAGLSTMADLGLSHETALERAGFDPEQEKQRREVQRQEMIEDQTVIGQGQMAHTVEMMGRVMKGSFGGKQKPEGGKNARERPAA